MAHNGTIINLGDHQQNNYSLAIKTIMETFDTDFEKIEIDVYDDIFDLIKMAWNAATFQYHFPDQKENLFHLNGSEFDNDDSLKLMRKIADYKNEYYNDYNLFIKTIYLEDDIPEPKLIVQYAPVDVFMNNFSDFFSASEYEDEISNFDDEPFYINRSIVLVMPKEPFLNWIKKTFDDEVDLMQIKNKYSAYLINELEDEDIENWLKKKFDKIFVEELEKFYANKKEWPQKRNYKMFTEWFTIITAGSVFDILSEPVQKSI